MAYINRELALELLKRNSITEHITFSDGVSIYDTIANIPAADVVPKVIGDWKPYKDYITRRQIGWICSNCSAVTEDLSNGDTDFCPHCGAIMETEEE